jgi:EAL domain-containing protein (putative c-di-GMP-specific phosphodiesterase class I)
MAVNVSAVQFGQESFLSFTEDVLRETGLAAEFLELEVTESVLLSNADVMASAMFKLSKIGAGLAIDDFGTGYCGFSYLRQFQFSRLKIDGSFVHALATDPREVSLTTAIINMGKTLNMKMIAECVETEAQLEILRSLGCDQVQGYYFDRPLGASAFAEKFRANHASLPN